MSDILLVSLGMAGLAIAMLALALFALGEYRTLFLANPRLLMSAEAARPRWGSCTGRPPPAIHRLPLR